MELLPCSESSFAARAGSLLMGKQAHQTHPHRRSTMGKLLLAMFAVLATSSAFANSQTQPAGCSMKFKVHVESYVFFSKGSGSGVVTCRNADGTIKASDKVH